MLLYVVKKCRTMRILFSFLIALALLSCETKTSVFVYPDPTAGNDTLNITSHKYKVEIVQNGKAFRSFVYQSENQMTAERHRDIMTDFNHWTTFSFSDPVQIRITKTDGTIKSASIHPSRFNIEPELSGSTMTFTINKPQKLFVNIEGEEEHPLFIFADEPETNIPLKEDENVLWFEPGVHYIGPQYKIASGTKVYIEGGAYLQGCFYVEDDATDVSIQGRGVVSGKVLGHLPGKPGIPFSVVYAPNKSGTCYVEGITVSEPPHFCLTSYGEFHVKNVKLFGWWHSTDGWEAGDNSTIDDSFMKVMDDYLKMYNNNQKATNLVFYQQMNGAPVQLCWGGKSSNQEGSNCLIENIDLVHCMMGSDARPGNSAFVCARHLTEGHVIENITIRNVWADHDIYEVIGLNGNHKGAFKNITLENFNIKGRQQALSYLYNTGETTFENIVFKDIYFGDTCFNSNMIELLGVNESDFEIICTK